MISKNDEKFLLLACQSENEISVLSSFPVPLLPLGHRQTFLLLLQSLFALPEREVVNARRKCLSRKIDTCGSKTDRCSIFCHIFMTILFHPLELSFDALG